MREEETQLVNYNIGQLLSTNFTRLAQVGFRAFYAKYPEILGPQVWLRELVITLGHSTESL